MESLVTKRSNIDLQRCIRYGEKECIPVGCVPPARYSTEGGLCPGGLYRGSLSRGVPLTETPPDGDPPGQRPRPPPVDQWTPVKT